MGRKANSLINQKFGKLLVIEDLGVFLKDGNKNKRHYVRCKCDCGNECIVSTDNLKKGNTISCGCYNIESKTKHNKYYTYGNITFVQFSNVDEYFICDTRDWIKLKCYCWHKSTQGYAVTRIDNKTVSFHRLLMNCNDNLRVDHIYQVSNGVCDNRRGNLRLATAHENTMNCRTRYDNSSGHSGIYWEEDRRKWRAQIGFNYKRINIGRFDTYEEAVNARKEAEIKYFGEFRNIN